ncbi:MAG: hypothetical protein Q9173_004575 [Seirophora scorigena]
MVMLSSDRDAKPSPDPRSTHYVFASLSSPPSICCSRVASGYCSRGNRVSLDPDRL